LFIFGNPCRIISNRGTAFTSNNFTDYCAKENIEQILITTGIPRANDQVERINRIFIPSLTKLTDPECEKCKYLDFVQSMYKYNIK